MEGIQNTVQEQPVWRETTFSLENATLQNETPGENKEFDFNYVHTPARVACYDSLMTAPRITEIAPGPTAEYIEHLTTTIYEQSHMAGGSIPYTTIREVSENFIHARFSEIIVSILDQGNTIRFADQGPGIPQKEKAQMPGFSSAVEPMKRYIRGVGSGLPLVREFLNSAHGTITIEDNIKTGAVVTISLNQKQEEKPVKKEESPVQTPSPVLTERQKTIMKILASQGLLGVSKISDFADIPVSSCSNELAKLQEASIVEMVGKKRQLTDYGKKICQQI